MSESARALLGFGIIAGAIADAIGWFDDWLTESVAWFLE